ncbi:MAG: hypothetical protein E4H09_04290, partial [Spirochaetales bacterium]
MSSPSRKISHRRADHEKENSMNEWASRLSPVLDGHVHMGSITEESGILEIGAATGIDRMALVSIQNPAAGSGLPQSLFMKARHPGRFYVFAGLNHATHLTDGTVDGPSLARQVAGFVEMGCDGIKMIESKPTSRRTMNVPLTDSYFAEYWDQVEDLGIPVVWHVADPEEFWDPATLPGWAREQKWGYGPDDVTKEALYADVDQVLARHPRLKITFAHLYFLSADLSRAARFLDEHPTVCFDLAPGVEMLYNCSRNPDTARQFMIGYADRIVLGTDLFSNLTVAEGTARAGILYRWLETDDTFRVPETADFLLGPPEDGIIRGLSLPDGVLNRIYRDNFTRIAGAEPVALQTGRAIEECERIGAIAYAMSGTPADQTEAGKVAQALAGELL